MIILAVRIFKHFSAKQVFWTEIQLPASKIQVEKDLLMQNNQLTFTFSKSIETLEKRVKNMFQR